ncbi:MAG: thymidylate synthase [Planctomycetes bacterium]|nr:thymidylate synthase [Planctomycetota bacterium]
MIERFTSETANEVWEQIATSFRQGDGWQLQNGRGGRTSELLHVALSIERPTERWVVSRSPAINPGFALAEVVWIVAGREDSSFVNAFYPDLAKWQGTGQTYHGAYGHRLRRRFGIDQLERAYLSLKENPDSRQIILQLWDVRADLPDEHGKERSPDVPCNVMSLLKIRDEHLEWMQIMRSNDVWRGLPHNIVQFTSLQEIMAGWLGCKVGTYNQISDSLHVYLDKEDAANIRSFAPLEAAANTDSIALPKADSDSAFQELASRVDRIIEVGSNPRNISDLARYPSAPEAIQNVLRVMAAELARRKQLLDLSQDLMADCSNPALSQLWDRWFERCHSKNRVQSSRSG